MKPRSEFRSFAGQEGGNVAVIVAILLIPLLLVVGVAVDSLRAYQTRTALQQALDAGVLAAGADPRLDDVASKAMISDIVIANTKKLPIGTVVIDYATSTVAGQELLEVSATANMKTAFMGFVGKDSLTLRAQNVVRRAQPGPVQVVLVVDATASMGTALGSGTRLDALKTAAKELADAILSTTNQGGNIGIVPFSLFVNLGLVNLGGAKDTWITPPTNVQVCDFSSQCFEPCIRDGGPAQCLNQSLPGCVKSNCRYTGSDCVSYRERSARTIITDQTTKKHIGIVAICAPPARNMTNVLATVKTNIDALHTVPIETHIPAGLMWAWNMLTPDLPIAGKPKTEVEDKGGRRAIILISDGENRNRPNDLGNGFFSGWTSGQVTANRADNPDILTEEICNNITASTNDPKIEIYTVLIGAQPQAMVDLMENCASDTSKAFTPTTRQDLIDAFKLIGEQLSRVRLNE